MADNVAVTAGTGTTIAADEVVDGTLGTVKVQYVKIMDGTLDGTTKAPVSTYGLKTGTVVTDSGGTALDYTVTAPVGTIGVFPNSNVSGTVTAATPISASSGNVANASAAATLAAGGAGKTTYIAGMTITAAGATAASVVTATLTNTIGGTLSWTFVFPAGVTTSAQPLVVEFCPPVPANATNTAMVLTLPAGGAGNTNASVSAWGFTL